ncbi:MAG: S9 family peptidase [Saprospiraceae bacterium]|nr:S9 family peptidase [Saprospiraceae bacterium]
MKKQVLTLILFWFVGAVYSQSDKFSDILEPINVFDLEYATDPQISPNGNIIAYVRNSKDIMTDANLSQIWTIQSDGQKHRPLSISEHSSYRPRWSPSGDRLAYVRGGEDGSEIFVRWVEDGADIKLTNLPKSPGSMSWSPDGSKIAFTMAVPYETKPFVSMPKKPEGAKWNDPPKVVDRLVFRRDGSGWVKDEYYQIFVMPADGGSATQLTDDPYHHGGNLAWSKDGSILFFSANGHENRDFEPRNSEIYSLNIESRETKILTNRYGPDGAPVVSPDGSKIAYVGLDDRHQGYQLTRLYVMNTDGSMSQCISCSFDRNVDDHYWAEDGSSLFIQYDDKGNTKLARITLAGNVTDLVMDVGGTSLGRPYSGGSFSVSSNGRMAFTLGTPEHPADVAVTTASGESKRLTRLNDDLFAYKKVGEVEEIWYKSSFDGRDVQGWICKPPHFDPTKKYPLILEIHGGPFTNYGTRFSAEVQLYAAAGYVVLYTNPRGSTSYGEEFGNLIHHNYPGEDYDDLISGVDAVIEKGYIDEERLYVTGGSGGGVLTSWIVGKTDRFRAAVVAKPVINWYSFVLYADGPGFFSKYWFPGKPWEEPEHYLSRSPISLVGNVTTPTMLLTGEEDYRTPMAETEQYYTALKLQGVETAMVRVPEASHGIAARPSNLIAKVVHILAWFEKYS